MRIVKSNDIGDNNELIIDANNLELLTVNLSSLEHKIDNNTSSDELIKDDRYMLLLASNILEKNNLVLEETIGLWGNESLITITENDPDIGNGKIMELFPQLKQEVMTYAEDNRVNTRVAFLFTDDKEIEEILELFIPDGSQLTWEGVEIKEIYSKDGEAHSIESIEEFFEYYNGEY